MDRLRQAALLTRLVELLRENGSWCGETHVQKGTYFLKELMKVPLDFEFIVYKHGPFSFDLRDELTALRADALLSLERASWPYGPRIAQTDQSSDIRKLYAKTLSKYDSQIKFVASKFGNKGVTELERLATALYVTLHEEETASVEERAAELTNLKPHIIPQNAKEAMEEIDLIMKEGDKLIVH